jgi:hypothetical protein
MCMFTGEVERVANTNIFARAMGERQLLVYSMTYAAQSPVAMVLPLPVPPDPGEDALRFISLEDCPHFFAELADGFPRAEVFEGSMMLSAGALDEPTRTLAVEEVGDYEASFVPSPGDFGRLDERFRLPPDLWLQLNTYRDYGFAVFKLKSTRLANVHPMAFEFPRRYRERLFFPTVHVHRQRVDRDARFDHALYCQPEPAMHWHLQQWEESEGAARRFLKCKAGRALVELEFPVWRAKLDGLYENTDSWVGAQGGLPKHLSGIVV